MSSDGCEEVGTEGPIGPRGAASVMMDSARATVTLVASVWVHEEDSPSGLWRTPGTRVGLTPSGVQIPHPPQWNSPGDSVESPGLFAFPGWSAVVCSRGPRLPARHGAGWTVTTGVQACTEEREERELR